MRNDYGMGLGMGFGWLWMIVILVLVGLAIAALVKYCVNEPKEVSMGYTISRLIADDSGR